MKGMWSTAARRTATAVAIVAALGTAAVTVELAVRAVTRVAGKCHPLCISEYDPALGWTLAPGTTGRHRHPELGVDVIYRIDARGARDMTRARKDVGNRRLIVLGDSNGFGWGVDYKRHFAAIVQASVPVEVLNLSVSGYGTDQALLRFRSEGLRFRPAFIVIQVTPNDLDDIQTSWVAGRPKPWFTLNDGALRLHNVPVGIEIRDARRMAGQWMPVRFRAWLLKRSFFYHWLNARLPEEPPPTPERARTSDTSLALFRALVEEIRTAASATGATVAVMHASSEMREHRAQAIPPGVEVLDLSDRFQAQGRAFFSDGLHWNEHGHRIAAEALAEWLVSRQLP